MSLIAATTRFVERAPLPLSKLGVAALVDQTRRSPSSRSGLSEVEFVRQMDRFPVALHVQVASRQHCELLADFLALTLGPARKTPAASIRLAKKRSLKPRPSRLEQPSGEPTSKTDSKFWNSDAAPGLSCAWAALRPSVPPLSSPIAANPIASIMATKPTGLHGMSSLAA
jgi:hypothetical protein